MWATKNEGKINEWILPTPQFYFHSLKSTKKIISTMTFYTLSLPRMNITAATLQAQLPTLK